MTDTIIVACKLPQGLILEVNDEKIKLNGIIENQFIQNDSFTLPSHVVGLTQVPKDFWEAWIKQNKEYSAYKKGLIFAAKNSKNAFAEAKEKAKLKHGFERIDPKTLPTKNKNTSEYSP